MIPYLGVVFASLVLAALADELARRVQGTIPRAEGGSRPDRAHKRTLLDWLPVALLVLFLGTRWNVGTDFYLYEYFYNSAMPDAWKHTLQSSPQELGYNLLQLSAKDFGFQYGGFLILMASITVVPIAMGIRREGLSLALGLTLYILLGHYLVAFNIVRQAAGMSLLFLATCLLPNRLLFLLVAVAASMLHSSAIPVAIAIYLTRNLQPSLRRVILAVLVGIVFTGLYASSSLIADLALRLNPRYATYLVEDESGLGSYLIAVSHILLVLILVLKRGKLERRTLAFTTYAMLGLPFIILGTQSVVLGRLELYFSMFLILALGGAWRHLGGLEKLGVLGLLAGYFVAHLMNFGDLLPYQSRWFQ